MRTQTILAGWLTLAGVAGCLGGPIHVNQVFPNFSDTDYFTKKPISLEQFRGKVVIVDFWATWCGPCVHELPNVQAVYKKHKDEGLEIISISLDTQLSKLNQFVVNHPMDWHHIADGKGWNSRLGRKYGVNSIPAMFVIGRDGKVAAVHPRGPLLEQTVAKALKQPAPKVGDDKPAKTELTEADHKQAKQWLEIADGMRKNENAALARKYYQKVIDAYPESKYAKLAADGIKGLEG